MLLGSYKEFLVYALDLRAIWSGLFFGMHLITFQFEFLEDWPQVHVFLQILKISDE